MIPIDCTSSNLMSIINLLLLTRCMYHILDNVMTVTMLFLFKDADQIISELSKQCSDLHTTMTAFHSELAQLPEVIKSIKTAKADIGW